MQGQIIAVYNVGYGEIAQIEKIGNVYYNKYGCQDQHYQCHAGPFMTFQKAEEMLYKHRPLARQIDYSVTEVKVIDDEIDLIYTALLYYRNVLLRRIKMLPDENIKQVQKQADMLFELSKRIRVHQKKDVKK